MMRLADLIHYAFDALSRHGFRTAMLLVAMSIGVGSVIVLTGLGEGARLYVVGELEALGNDMLIMLPGKKETTGGLPPLTGESARDITLEDVEILARVPMVSDIAPLVVGSALVAHGGRSREAIIIGSSAAFFDVRALEISQGSPLPDTALDRASPVCVIGSKLRDTVFGSRNALGEWLRVGDRRFRVVGVLSQLGESQGMDMSEVLIIPVASAQMLFNVNGMFRVLFTLKPGADPEAAKEALRRVMIARHDGEDDTTMISQEAMLSAFDNILSTLTLAVGGIGGISLLVAGILIMNVTLINVSHRTREIGLLKALGASTAQVRLIFLTEAVLVALAGALLGVALGECLMWLGRQLFPSIPFTAPWWAIISAVVVSVVAGLLFALLPANKAARLEPVTALHG